MPQSPTSGRPGVLFDVDGTLLDTNYLHVLAWWQGLRDAGHHGVTMAEVHQAIGIASEQLVEKLVGQPSEAAIAAHSERYEKLRDQVVAFDRAADLVSACADRGYSVVLATSGKESDLDWMLPAIGAEDGLAGSATSSDVEQAKPAPDLLVTAMQKNNLDPARTVAVGDTVWDIQSAHDAGVAIIALTCGGISRQQLREAGADQIFDDPADLLDPLGRLPAGQPRPGLRRSSATQPFVPVVAMPSTNCRCPTKNKMIIGMVVITLAVTTISQCHSPPKPY
ncbi:phosphoglycolate phosphatase-like HAD superfamily hydrolase [Microlunatus panaciterrae]|uniref:Phosphoglycolate phosphatase-like HAD superfamily hydrolase n=1 Tax=Microlunatus panaciterrae TaxID=400768 RepID=A0ABS2RF82_9ACTN|nr:phosphoglycolate phosphatase-like HAD superfamily hydrolase [Microlunatus panaciterrae]